MRSRAQSGPVGRAVLIRGVLIGAALAALAALPAAIAAQPASAQQAPRPDAAAWLVIDPSDGTVLTAHRARRPMPMASTTKLMTALVAARELGLGRDVRAAAYDANPAESLAGLEAGDRVSMRDLMLGLLLASGNDAAVTAATAASGSVAAFVDEMNATARELGLAETRFRNPIGLDAPGHRSSARDLAALAVELRRRPFFRRALDRERATIALGDRSVEIVNRNQLVRRVGWVDGVKTGFTAGAGNVLIASGTRRGVGLVSVVIGVPSEAERDDASLALLEWGFSRYRREAILARGETVAGVAVRYRSGEVALEAARGVTASLRRRVRAELAVEAPAEVEGPIDAGEPLGTVVVSAGDRTVDTVPLLAAETVARATVLERMASNLPGSGIVLLGLGLLLLGAIVAVRARRDAARKRRERERARRHGAQAKGRELG